MSYVDCNASLSRWGEVEFVGCGAVRCGAVQWSSWGGVERGLGKGCVRWVIEFQDESVNSRKRDFVFSRMRLRKQTLLKTLNLPWIVRPKFHIQL